jgi:hypothetical protein
LGFFADDLNVLIALGAGIADDGYEIVYSLRSTNGDIDSASHGYILIGDYFDGESKWITDNLLIGILKIDSG